MLLYQMHLAVTLYNVLNSNSKAEIISVSKSFLLLFPFSMLVFKTTTKTHPEFQLQSDFILYLL
jgi:hypothetical protein